MLRPAVGRCSGRTIGRRTTHRREGGATAATDPTWNFQDPASKDRVLGVLRNEMDTTFALVADPARWQADVQQPYSVGIRTSGRNGGDMRGDVSADGVQFSPGSIEDCAAILEFDPATLVLTGYGRINGGTVRGDPQIASEFRSLFFPI